MFETPMTVVGNVVTEPQVRNTAAGRVTSFRMASNSRRREEDGTWVTDKTLFLSVSCWGKLGSSAAFSLAKGRPLIAVGMVHTSEYLTEGGATRSSLEMRATSLGIDMNRALVTMCGYPAGEAPVTPGEVPAPAGGGDVPAVEVIEVDDEIEGPKPATEEDLAPAF